MSPSRVVSIIITAFLVVASYGQSLPTSQPTSEPARPILAADILAVAQARLDAAQKANQDRLESQAKLLLDDAQHAVDIVLRSEPKNSQARALAADIAAESGDQNKARELYKALWTDERSNFQANLGLGRYYVHSHLWRQARSYLADADKVAPAEKRGEVLRLLAVCYNGEGNRLDAIASAERALAADPKDLESAQLLVQVRLIAEQYEKAVENANSLVDACRREYQSNPSDAQVLARLISALGIDVSALRACFKGLCRKDAHGDFTDQLTPGTEGKAVDLLSQIAYLTEEEAKLRWEYTYQDVLLQLRQMVESQTDANTRTALDSNTRLLLNKASLLQATHQTEQAIETYQRLLELTHPSDETSAAAAQNKEAARKALLQLNAPLTSQPTSEPAP